MKEIVVFGGGGHAKAVIDVIEQAGKYRILGLLDSNKPPGTEVYGYEVLGDERWIGVNKTQVHGGIIAIGDNWTRAAVAGRMLAEYPDFIFITAVHPLAAVARGAVIGQGSVLMAGAAVGSDAVLGGHNVLYSKASADHDSSLGNFVTLAPGATTGGGTRVGDFSVISLGASVIHSVKIGEHTVIGAGATVISDIPGYSVAYGTPARIIRTRRQGERYL